jgi:hypothetical protein
LSSGVPSLGNATGGLNGVLKGFFIATVKDFDDAAENV